MLASTLLSGAPSTQSPFVPAKTEQQGPQAGNEILLTGMSRIGDRILVCVQDATGKSRWIPEGEKSEGIEVLTCNYEAGTVSVLVEGKPRTLVLRKAAIKKGEKPPPTPTSPASSPAQSPQANASAGSPPAPGPEGAEAPPPRPPETTEEKEHEARMMVSDFLEMSLRQRKAYEAEKRRVEGAAKNAPESKK